MKEDFIIKFKHGEFNITYPLFEKKVIITYTIYTNKGTFLGTLPLSDEPSIERKQLFEVCDILYTNEQNKS